MFRPPTPFFIFGMGPRRKLLYKEGALYDVAEKDKLFSWDVRKELIAPERCRLRLELRDGKEVVIREDEEGVFLEEDGAVRALERGPPVKLPCFSGSKFAALLRTLHQELLVNIIPAGPTPNLFVYPTAWYRDAAMVCMCLARTGNLDLVADWIRGLDDPFDRQNGTEEPDNLGQVLYMISLVADRSHPLVTRVLKEAERFRKGDCIEGPTDGGPKPVYQTKWLKLGLKSLGLEDTWAIPRVHDPYSALFWMDYRDEHVPRPPFGERSRRLFPYLGWAEDHFHGRAPADLPEEGAYPLTWESEAAKADYEGMSIVSPEYTRARTCAPHTWHAAEMFLYLWQVGRKGE